MKTGGSGRLFNTLSVILLGFTALACLCYTTLFFVPTLAGPFAGPTAVAQVPNHTPTPAPPVLPPTWTPTPTNTPADTPTPYMTWTPEPVEVRPTNTLIPTRTKAPTPGPSPTPSSTRSRYPYTADVTYQPSPIGACSSSYVLGTITDLEGKPVTSNNMIVHLEGDADIDTGFLLHPGEQFRGKRVEGRSPFTGMGFGPSAWSVAINFSSTTAGTWYVWLVQGGQVSERVQVQLQSDCLASTAIVRFQQNH